MRILQAASGTTSKGPTFSSEEEKEQEIGNLFEKIMKENFPSLVKEWDVQVQEAQSPKQDGHKEDHNQDTS